MPKGAKGGPKGAYRSSIADFNEECVYTVDTFFSRTLSVFFFLFYVCCCLI